MKTVLLAFLVMTGMAAADPMPQPAPIPVQGGVMVPIPPREQLRAAVLARFDKNHDGVLEPKERRHAAKALRRMARRLAREDGAAPARRQRRDFE